ncbi:hypothetical protein BC939DRAFT_180774 [Gamsiella multidivaricata]|uniref:uncharacterized protein n=1 Tax=Gamsiella multidivaricata TaxID=101098 RepID=UPI00221F67B9|nr:uncharacterized protein BC939DRAFT_180774 [Gamsiella multidivaricata]KAI7822587.1 hypothetical protein BC939DRAFT_180774 [Gamsiella multidivaricata]
MPLEWKSRIRETRSLVADRLSYSYSYSGFEYGKKSRRAAFGGSFVVRPRKRCQGGKQEVSRSPGKKLDRVEFILERRFGRMGCRGPWAFSFNRFKDCGRRQEGRKKGREDTGRVYVHVGSVIIIIVLRGLFSYSLFHIHTHMRYATLSSHQEHHPRENATQGKTRENSAAKKGADNQVKEKSAANAAGRGSHTYTSQWNKTSLSLFLRMHKHAPQTIQ